MIPIIIDDFELYIKPNISVLDACKLVGINIPRFCYHELLSISGNCRMCLVEIENAEKPVASCVTEAESGMSILSNTPFVQKARENVVEALLVNHPLDCPICDQAGECDLQDQVKKYGGNFSRFYLKKTSVEDKYCGPLIKTVMTRCISCTRCVRFSSEISGIDFYGTLNRGQNTEIGSYIPNFFNSEISGNVIDLCPVGALTSAPYAAKARPWELRVTETIDVTDSLNSNIYVNFKETDLLRVIPKPNKELNDSLISDKTRYNYDANSINRLISVVGLKNKTAIKQTKLGWNNFFNVFDKILAKQPSFSFIVDSNLDYHGINSLKKLKFLYPEKINLQSLYISKIGNYYSNSNYNSVLNYINNLNSGGVLFLGTNLKLENAIINTKIRVKINNNFIKGYAYGFNSYENVVNLNSSKTVYGLHAKLKQSAISLQNGFSLIVIGESFKDRVSNLSALKKMLTENITSARVFYIGLKANTEAFNLSNFKNSNKLYPLQKNHINFFVNNDDNVFVRKLHAFKNIYTTLWYNTHGSVLSQKSSFVLPSVSSFEREQLFINMEHRAQKTSKILSISKGCKHLLDILGSLFDLPNKVFYENKENAFEQYLSEMSSNKALYTTLLEANKNFANRLDTLYEFEYLSISKLPLITKIKNFYQTDTFSRNSKIMNSCATELITNFNNFKK